MSLTTIRRSPFAAASAEAKRVRERGHAVGLFQRVLRRDEPPYLVEVEVAQRQPADMQVTTMRGVERTAEQPDAAMRGQGRTWPVPRTRYL